MMQSMEIEIRMMKEGGGLTRILNDEFGPFWGKLMN
jgi:hypothetical protein